MSQTVMESQLGQGQPEADLKSMGQSSDEVSTDGEPTGAEVQSETTPTPEIDFEAKYKELQTEFGKRNESLKGLQSQFEAFERFGGAERILSLAEELDSNPKFIEWYRDQQNAQVVGDEYSEYDDDTKKALELVSKMSQAEIQKELGPIKEELMEKRLEQNLEVVKSKYSNFDDMRDKMSELAANLPQEIQNNPSVDDLEDLYWKAMRVSGKMEEYAAKQYESKLQEAKKQSTDAPSGKAAPSKLQGKLSMVEAAKAAGWIN